MVRPVPPHPWNVSPTEAIRIQKSLRGLVSTTGRIPKPRWVAGADISWEKGSDRGFAGVILYRFPDLEEVERQSALGPAPFPYVPGLLSFREGPLLLDAIARLETRPDLIFFDGQGMAHPRRLGIASHLGLLLGIPTIGVAKSRLCGTHREPGPRRGNRASLRDKGETIGYVLRTRTKVNPVFVSVGHGLELNEAVRLTLRCCDGYRIPRPTRWADRFAGQLRRREIPS